MTDIKDNPPPLPISDCLINGIFKTFNETTVRQIEAAAFERCRAIMQPEIDRLKQIERAYLARQIVMDELRAQLKAREEQEPVADVFMDASGRVRCGFIIDEPEKLSIATKLYTAAGAKDKA